MFKQSQTIRYITGLVFSLSLGWCALHVLAADEPTPAKEPPVRLQKKGKAAVPAPGVEELDKKPVPEEAKPTPAEKPEQGTNPDLKPTERSPLPEEQPDPQAILSRVAKNMRAVEDRLGKNEATDGLRETQREIIKDLDELIKQQENSQSSSSSSSSSSSPSSASESEGQKAEQKQTKQSVTQKQQQSTSRPQSRRDRNKGQAGEQKKPEPGNEKKPGGGDPKNESKEESKEGSGGAGQPKKPGGAGGQPGQGGDSPTGPNPLADVFKDIWGHLPEAKRAEMEAYAREKFMPKYNDLIKQYYSKLSEKSQRKGD